MKIFLSHASQDRSIAESIVFSLRGRGYEVFLDRDDLPAGASYDQQIERAINESDTFVFLISPDSVAGGRYTLTELTLARRKWPDPNGRVLPVMVHETSLDRVPSYLKAVTILEPVGNIPAETSAAVDHLTRSTSQKKDKRKSPWPRSDILTAIGIAVAAVGSIAAVVVIPEFYDRIFGPGAHVDPVAAQGNAAAKVSKTCRIPSNGVERYGRAFDVNRDSGWRGGGTGYSTGDWCAELKAALLGEHPDGQFTVVTYSEDHKNTCWRGNCPQYLYHCTVHVQTDPVYFEKASADCPP